MIPLLVGLANEVTLHYVNRVWFVTGAGVEPATVGYEPAMIPFHYPVMKHRSNIQEAERGACGNVPLMVCST